MLTQTYNAAPATHGFAERATNWLKSRRQAFHAHQQAALRASELAALDDRTLADIGLHRAEILSFASNPKDVTRIR